MKRKKSSPRVRDLASGAINHIELVFLHIAAVGFQVEETGKKPDGRRGWTSRKFLAAAGSA